MTQPNITPVTSEIVDLVETMRQAQIKFFEMSKDRSGKYQDHQKRRALQAAQAAEHAVDVWLSSYRAERKKYEQAFTPKQTDEVQGSFEA